MRRSILREQEGGTEFTPVNEYRRRRYREIPLA